MPFAPDFLSEYIPDDGIIDNNEDFNIVRDNLTKMAALKLKKLKNKKSDVENKEELGIEKSHLKEVIEKIKIDRRDSINISKKGKKSFAETVTVGHLVYKNRDVFFKDKKIKMRPQIKRLCVLFMKNHKEFIDYSNLMDELVSAEKRKHTNMTTIKKYVSELHNLLRRRFGKKVIFNDKIEGYILNIEKRS